MEDLHKIVEREGSYFEAHTGETIAVIQNIETRTFRFEQPSVNKGQRGKETIIEARARESFQKKPTTPRAHGYEIISSHGDSFPKQATVAYVLYAKI